MRRRTRLTKRDACILGRYAQGLDEVDPRVLERMADRLLARRPGRRTQEEYPVLSEDQRKRRLNHEVPLGGLIECVTVNPVRVTGGDRVQRREMARLLESVRDHLPYHPGDWTEAA